MAARALGRRSAQAQEALGHTSPEAPSECSTASVPFHAQGSDVGGPAAAMVVHKLQEQQAELARLLRVQQAELESVRRQQLSLQERQAEPMRLLRSQQAELENVRQNQLSLQHLLSQQQTVVHNPSQPQQANLHELVVELKRLLQKETSNDVSGSAARDLLDTFGSTPKLLQELREERVAVVDMLDGVKQEKCEVIKMMHSFAMDKAEALQELEGWRRTVHEELLTMVASVRQEEGQPQLEHGLPYPVEAPSFLLPAPSSIAAPSSMQRRHPSRPSLTLSSAVVPPGSAQRVALAVQAAPHAQATAVAAAAPTTTVLGGVTVQQTAHVPFLVTSSVHMAPNSPGPDGRRLDETGRRARSPVRQFSSSVQTMPGQALVSVACSPNIVTRSTPLDLARSGKQLPVAERKASPLRRFVSAGMTPRTAHLEVGVATSQVCGSQGAGWGTTASWTATSPVIVSRG